MFLGVIADKCYRGSRGPHPEHRLPAQYHWCLGPKAEIDLVVERPGRHMVLLDCINRIFDNQGGCSGACPFGWSRPTTHLTSRCAVWIASCAVSTETCEPGPGL